MPVAHVQRGAVYEVLQGNEASGFVLSRSLGKLSDKLTGEALLASAKSALAGRVPEYPNAFNPYRLKAAS